MAIIYCATNKVNGKKYVGQTRQTLPGRIRGHKYAANSNGKTVFAKAIRKYGFENFEWEIIGECPHNWLDTVEKLCIESMQTMRPNGYNSCEGGCGPKGQQMSAEARAKMSKARKGHEVSEETRAKIRAGHLGKKKNNGEACRRRMLANPISEEKKRKMQELSKKYKDEHPECIARGARSGKARAVRCLETGIIFDTLEQAAQWSGSSSQLIGRVCRGIKKHTAGYSWEYV
jgi:group I intron endonuclease